MSMNEHIPPQIHTHTHAYTHISNYKLDNRNMKEKNIFWQVETSELRFLFTKVSRVQYNKKNNNSFRTVLFYWENKYGFHTS